MINVNRMNVYPRIVEEMLYQHPAVREAAVVGEPDELHGEIRVAEERGGQGERQQPPCPRIFEAELKWSLSRGMPRELWRKKTPSQKAPTLVVTAGTKYLVELSVIVVPKDLSSELRSCFFSHTCPSELPRR